VLHDIEPHLLDTRRQLGRPGATTRSDPRAITGRSRSARLAVRPGQDAERRRQLARRGDQPEPVGDALDLIVGTGRVVLAHPAAPALGDRGRDLVAVRGEARQILAYGDAVEPPCRVGPMAGERCTVGMAVQRFEHAERSLSPASAGNP